MSQHTVSESQIFRAAVKLSAEDQARYLDDACHGDHRLRSEVESLLRAHDPNHSFLYPPAAAITLDRTTPEQVGTLIGHYKLLEQIGEGGMGLVYMAEQQQPMRRLVALKLVKPGMDSKQVIARFEAERQALAMMDHPNIAKVHDAGTTEAGRPYFVMELVRGIPLNEFCDQKRLAVRERLQLFVQVCQAVQHAHQKGIIHRDLKPTNVLVAMADTVAFPKLLDFGIAKALGQSLTDSTLHTGYSQLVGTPLYMSPEQAEMNVFGVDTRSDVYSLGVLLYELLTGTTPFDKEQLTKANFDEMRRMIREDDPPRPSARMSTLKAQALSTISQQRNIDPRRISATLRGELDWIVMKALEKDRSRRYESASALAADIQRHLSDEPVLACPPTTMYRFQKFARKHKPALATAAVIAASLILGTTVSAWQAARATTAEAQANANATQAQASSQEAKEKAQEATTQRDEAQKQRDEAQRQRDEVKALADKLAAKDQQLQQTLYAAHMNLAQHAWEAGATDRVQELLVQHRPKPGENDVRGFEWHYLDRLCHANVQALRGHTDYVYDVAFSPDGKRLASASADKTVKIWDVQTGKELLTFKGNTGDVNSVVFSPDGTRVASCTGSSRRLRGGSREGRGVKVWDAQTGEELLHMKDGYTPVVYSPDGKRLAATIWGETDKKNDTVKIWDAQTGRELSSWKPHENGINALAFSPDGSRFATAAAGGQVKVWDGQTAQLEQSMKGGGYGLDFRFDGKRLISAGVDGESGEWSAKIWNADTGETILSIKDVGSMVVFSPDGKHVASSGGSRDRTMRIFDAETGSEIRVIKGGGRNVAYSRDGSRLASCAVEGSSDYAVRIWNPGKNEESTFIKSAGGGLFSPDGKWLATISDDQNMVILRDATTLQETLRLKGHTALIYSLAFSPDGKRLASGGSGRRTADGGTSTGPDDPAEVKIWNLATGSEVLSIERKGGQLWGLAYSPDGKRLASAGRVWDAETGRELSTLPSAGGWGRMVAFSPDGRHVASATGAGGPNQVTIFNAQTNVAIRTLEGGGQGVAFSPDGKRLASAAMRPDVKVSVWNVETWDEIYTVKGGGRGVAFSPDGKRLASGLKLWDAESGQELLSLKGGGGYGIAFSPDGNRLVGSTGSGLTIWDATPLPEKP